MRTTANAKTTQLYQDRAPFPGRANCGACSYLAMHQKGTKSSYLVCRKGGFAVTEQATCADQRV